MITATQSSLSRSLSRHATPPCLARLLVLALALGCSSSKDDHSSAQNASGITGAGGGGSMQTAGSGGTSSGGVAGNGGATACSGKPGSKRGKSTQMVMAAGAARTFVYYAPATLDANAPVPLVVVPHGYTMNAEQMYSITGYDKIADREGFAVVYPDGEGTNPWNVGSGVCGLGASVNATGDDQAFMKAILDFVEADQCLDHSHVFMTGFSMGGYFSHETACVNAAFRAAGPHSGGTHDLSTCPEKHKPMIIFHFKDDALIGYSCATAARDEWIKHNGCSPDAPDVTMVKSGSCEYYKGCPADGQVALCSFDKPADGFPMGMAFAGHGWAGGSRDMSDFAIPNAESASELGWAFFKKYAW